MTSLTLEKETTIYSAGPSNIGTMVISMLPTVMTYSLAEMVMIISMVKETVIFTGSTPRTLITTISKRFGCTQVVTQNFETIEFRTNDDRCAIQVDIWELT